MEEHSSQSAVMDENVNTLSAFLNVDSNKLNGIEACVLTQLLAKANELNNLKAENLKFSVVLDETRSSSTRKVDALKDHIQKLLKDIEDLRKEQNSFEEQKVKLMDERARASGETRSLKLKVEELAQQKELCESSKRDAVKLLNEKINDLAASKQEADHLLGENKELRKKILDLENEVRTCRSTELRNKSDLQRCTQEVSLVKSNSEWFEKELNAKTTEFDSYRQKTNSELHKALNELNAVKNEFELISSTAESLRKKNNELSMQLQEKLVTIKHLTDSLNTEKHEFTREMSLKQRLVDLLEKQVESLKKELESVHSSTSNRAEGRDSENEKIAQELLDARKQLEKYESKIIKLEETVQELLSTGGELDDAENTNTSVSSKSAIPKLYSDIGVLKKQLIHERRQKELLQSQVEEFVVELEHKVPILNSFKERNEMLEKELTETALMLESVSKDKDDTKQLLTRSMLKITNYEGQIRSLIRQRSDLAHQVQYLLIHIEVRNDSKGPLTLEEGDFIRRIIDSEENTLDPDTQKIISERLVNFQNVVELQNKNIELLDSIRSLADKLEGEEQEKKMQTNSIENETVEEAKEAILTLQEHNQMLESQINVLTKERDVFKTISRNGIHNIEQNGDGIKMEEIRASKEEKFQELEKQLLTITEESKNNVKLLNQEIQSLYRSKAELSISLGKEISSKTLTEDRLKMVQQTLELVTQENVELRRRSQLLQDNVLQQDTNTQKTIDQLIKCKSRLAQLESEVGNLKSERNLLRVFEKGLKEDNDRLVEEKNRMTILVTQLQTLQNERETLLADTQKSYQDKLDKAETEITEALTKLEKKSEDIDEYISSKDSQAQWYQEKIDTLNASLIQAKTELDSKNSVIDHLESDLKILRINLQESEAKVQSYNVFNNTDDALSQTEALRKQIEKMNIQLKDAYSQLEEYKSLVAVSEESSTAISKAFEDSKVASQKTIHDLRKEKDMIKDKVSILNDQIVNLNSELDHQKQQFESQKSDLIKKLEQLENSENSITEVKAEYSQVITKLKEDLNQQAAYANTAQKNYEQELQKHANVSKTISLLREESQNYKNEMESLKDASENARRLLEQSEQSWTEQKSEYENQLSLVNQRAEDLSTQNRLLYEQLDLLTKGIPEGTDQEANKSLFSRDLISTLRRERDILETKLEVVKRDEKSYRQKLQFAESELERVRTELMQLQQSNDMRSSVIRDHDEIMEQLNQVNLLRESNMTLRLEAKTTAELNQELQSKVEELQTQLQPLETQIGSLERLVKEHEQQIALSKEETNRWKQRSQDILHKYERVDPEEYQKLIEEVSELKSDIQKRTEQNSELEDRFQRLKKQARERLDASKTAQNSLSSELNEARETQKSLEEELSNERNAHKALESKVQELSQSDAIDASKLQQDLASTLAKLSEAESKLQSAEDSHAKVEQELREELAQLNEKLVNLEKQLEVANQNPTATDNTSNTLKQMKEEFEEEKRKMLAERDSDLKREFEEEKRKMLAERESELKREFEEQKLNEFKAFESELRLKLSHEPTIDIEALKKEWEEEYENKTASRINEANELLRKRIRLPTEEKINKIIETRKNELEKEYESKVEELTKERSSQKPTMGGFTEVMKNHKQEIEKLKDEMRTQFNEEIAQVKKKAFDEGKQQASMKSTFLEKKISKLEAQLRANHSKQPDTVSEKPLERPMKITEASPLEGSQNPEILKQKIMPIKTVPLESSKTDSSPQQLGSNSSVLGYGLSSPKRSPDGLEQEGSPLKGLRVNMIFLEDLYLL